MKTSLKLSKLLQEKGFSYALDDFHSESICPNSDCECENENGHEYIVTPRYDIIYDICIKYAKELFGESGYYTGAKFTGIKTMREAHDRVEEFRLGLEYRSYKETAEAIFKMIQYEHTQEEIEEYITKHLKFKRVGT